MFDNIKVYSCQLALFVSAGAIRADELSFAIRSKMDVGEFEPMLIPESPGMPDEFPRLSINTPKGYKLSMSKARIDFLIDLPLGVDEQEFNEFKTACKVLCSILDEKGFKFSRVGFVKTLFESMPRATQFLVQDIARLALQDSTDFSMTISAKRKYEKWGCNSIYSLSNGLRSGSEVGLVVARDVNIGPENEVALVPTDVDGFLSFAEAECSVENLRKFIEGK